MDKTKKENRIKVNINKFYQFTIFKKLQEPEIKIKNKVRSNSLISAIKKRKKDIEKIIDNTKFQNNDELIKFEDYLKKNKYHLIKSRNIFPIMKDERNNPSSFISHPSSVYDLQGRKVVDNLSSLTSHPSPLKRDIYIVNRKKVITR